MITQAIPLELKKNCLSEKGKLWTIVNGVRDMLMNDTIHQQNLPLAFWPKRLNGIYDGIGILGLHKIKTCPGGNTPCFAGIIGIRRIQNDRNISVNLPNPAAQLKTIDARHPDTSTTYKSKGCRPINSSATIEDAAPSH